MKKRVLVVDDDADMREVLAFDLLRRGYEVVEAEDGRRAHALHRGRPVDLVLSDVHMPGGDGSDLLRRLKEEDAEDPPVILITGFAEMEPQEAYHAGAEAVFSKPFDRKALFAAVERLLAGPERAWGAPPELIQEPVPTALETRVLKLGRGGALVEGGAGAEGALLRLDLELEGFQDRLRGLGVLRWSREQGGVLPAARGVEFLRLEEPGRWALRRALEGLRPRAYIPAF